MTPTPEKVAYERKRNLKSAIAAISVFVVMLVGGVTIGEWIGLPVALSFGGSFMGALIVGKEFADAIYPKRKREG